MDDAGAVLVDKGRARMKYRLDDDRIYNPSISNLKESDASQPNIATVAAEPSPKTAARRKNKSRSASAPTFNPNVDPDAIIAFTDGACSGNPGPAGLGYTVQFPSGKRIAKGEPLGDATNNIAELTAILRVLENIDDADARILIHTDSSYSIGVLTAGWKAKANQALIAKIKTLLQKFKNTTLVKVKGHAGIEDNEIVDGLAREAAESQRPVDLDNRQST